MVELELDATYRFEYLDDLLSACLSSDSPVSTALFTYTNNELVNEISELSCSLDECIDLDNGEITLYHIIQFIFLVLEGSSKEEASIRIFGVTDLNETNELTSIGVKCLNKLCSLNIRVSNSTIPVEDANTETVQELKTKTINFSVLDEILKECMNSSQEVAKTQFKYNIDSSSKKNLMKKETQDRKR